MVTAEQAAQQIAEMFAQWWDHHDDQLQKNIIDAIEMFRQNYVPWPHRCSAKTWNTALYSTILGDSAYEAMLDVLLHPELYRE